MKKHLIYSMFIFTMLFSLGSINIDAKQKCSYYKNTKIKQKCTSYKKFDDVDRYTKIVKFYNKKGKLNKTINYSYQNKKLNNVSTFKDYKKIKQKFKYTYSSSISYDQNGKLQSKSYAKKYQSGKYKYYYSYDYQDGIIYESTKLKFYNTKINNLKEKKWRIYDFERKKNRLQQYIKLKYPKVKKKNKKTKMM